MVRAGFQGVANGAVDGGGGVPEVLSVGLLICPGSELDSMLARGGCLLDGRQGLVNGTTSFPFFHPS